MTPSTTAVVIHGHLTRPLDAHLIRQALAAAGVQVLDPGGITVQQPITTGDGWHGVISHPA